MKKSKVDGEFCSRPLPEIGVDLWGKILLEAEVSLKTLGKLRCSCKCWNRLITSRKFKQDLIESGLGRSELLLLKSFRSWEEVRGVKTFCIRTKKEVPIELPLSQRMEDFHIVGSSRGLLCIDLTTKDDKTEKVAIWNPFLEIVKPIPERCDPGAVHCVPNDKMMGFGYGNRDFKYVRIFDALHESEKLTTGADVYSLNSKTWSGYREIPSLDLSFAYPLRNQFGTCVDESIYWLYSDHDQSQILLCFACCTESFTTRLLKEDIPSLLQVKYDVLTLGVLRNRLAVFHRTLKKECHMYERVHLDGAYIWEKNLQMSRREYYRIPWPFSGSEQRIHVVRGNSTGVSKLAFYNWNRDRFFNTEIQLGRKDHLQDNFVGAYEECLTLLQ